LPSSPAAEFLQVRDRIVPAITAGIGRKRARLAIGKPKIFHLAGIPPELRQQTCALPEAESKNTVI
jgi:hypothetical protein